MSGRSQVSILRRELLIGAEAARKLSVALQLSWAALSEIERFGNREGSEGHEPDAQTESEVDGVPIRQIQEDLFS